jgi:sulfotransferase 6B1
MDADYVHSPLANTLRRLRWRARRVNAAIHYGQTTLKKSPVLFGNSVPKSGTHLLAQILSAFPSIGVAVERGIGPVLTFERQTGRERTTDELLHDLRQLGPGDVCFGHIVATPEVRDYWRGQNVAHYFMLRDPRDVVVSHAFYIADKATQNVHHAYYKSLGSLEERIQASIQGRPDWQGEGSESASFPDIKARYQRYLDWLKEPGICVLRFEEFLGAREENLSKMLDEAVQREFYLQTNREAAIQVLAAAIQPTKSFTFRKGEAGNWREHFTAEHKSLFKEIAGDLLIQLGYESNLDW